MKTGLAGAKAGNLSDLPMPCVGFVRGVQEASTTRPPDAGSVVKTDGHPAAVFRRRPARAETLALEEFAAHFEPTLLSPRAASSADDPDSAAPRAFNFSWFLPELGQVQEHLEGSAGRVRSSNSCGAGDAAIHAGVIDKVVVHRPRARYWSRSSVLHLPWCSTL